MSLNPLGGSVKRKLLKTVRYCAKPQIQRVCARIVQQNPRKELRIAAVAATRKYHASVREFVLPKLEYRNPLDRGLGVDS